MFRQIKKIKFNTIFKTRPHGLMTLRLTGRRKNSLGSILHVPRVINCSEYGLKSNEFEISTFVQRPFLRRRY